MIFVVGGEHLDASTRRAHTSGPSLDQTKNHLPPQTIKFKFDQYCFSKVLVARSFEFAKTLVAKVVEFCFCQAVVKTPSRLDPRVIGNAPMSPVSRPGRALCLTPNLRYCFGRCLICMLQCTPCLPCALSLSPPPTAQDHGRYLCSSSRASPLLPLLLSL